MAEEGWADSDGMAVQGQAAALPVLSEVREARPIDRPGGSALAAPVAVATGGFLAGIATLVLMRVFRRSRRRPRLAVGRRRGREAPLDVVASRSFLVDVHLLKR